MKPESRNLRRARFISQNTTWLRPHLQKLMIATATNEEAAPAGQESSLLVPGYTFHRNGRHYIVMKTDDDATIEVEVVRAIATDLIDPHPKNRTWCEASAMHELTESIREHGQSSPGILRPHPDKPGRFQLIAGWRRWNACKTMGWPLQAMVRELDDVQALEQLYLENAQRENLRPLDEAELVEGMLELRDAQGHRLFTLERVALARYGSAKAGDVARVAKVHKLRLLPEVLRGPVNDGVVPLRVAFLVARIVDPVDREKAGGEVLKDPYTYGDDRPPMTVKRAMKHIAKHYQVNLKGWPYLERVDLLNEEQRIAMGFTGAAGESGDGSCMNCPYLAKNSPLFHDALSSGSKKGSGESGIDPNTCTRASCHRSKLDAVWRLQAVEFAAANGLPAESVMGLEESQKLRNDLAVLDSRPNGYQLGDYEKSQDKKNPTWDKILKGSGAEIKVAADDKGKPVLVCDEQLAITVGRGKHADLFAKAPVPGDDGLSRSDVQALRAKQETGELTADELKMLEEIDAADEKERIASLKQEMERAVKREARVDSLRELLEKLTDKGPGLIGAHAMVMSVCREHGYDFLAFLTQRDQGELEAEYDNDYDIEEGLTKHLKGRTVNELLAIAAVAAVWDDVNFSGQDSAADFQSMCKAVNVDTKAIFDRVKKAHGLAFKASEKARAAKLKEEKGAGKKAGKNSSNPTDWSTEKEASRTAAADAIDRASTIPAGDVPPMPEAVPSEDDTGRVVVFESRSEDDEAALLEALLNRDIPIFNPGEDGIFVRRAVFSYQAADRIGFSIDLVRNVEAQWSAGHESSVGGVPSIGGFYPSADGMFDSRLDALRDALSDLYSDWSGYSPKAKHMAPWESTRALIARLQEGVSQAIVAVSGPAPSAAAPVEPVLVDYDKVDVAAAADAVKAGTHEVGHFIGVKPHKQKDAVRFKAWDALRNKILRKAGLKK